MAAITGAALVAAGTAYAANQQKKAAQGAANSAKRGAAAGLQQYKEYNQPFYDAGTSSLSRLERLNAGDFSAFEQSPDYQFAFDQGVEGINRAAASRGALNSGGTDIDLMRFGHGMARQNYGDYYSRLAQLAAAGHQSAQGIGGQAVGASNLAGQAQGQGMIGGANATSGMISGLSGLLGQFQGQQGFGNNRQSTIAPSGGAFAPQGYGTQNQFSPGYNFNFGRGP